jgi:hypothetical protein
MPSRPFSNEPTSRSRLQLTRKQLAGKIKRRALALVLRVKVRRLVFLEEHPNHDPEEHGDDRHAASIPSSLSHDGLTNIGPARVLAIRDKTQQTLVRGYARFHPGANAPTRCHACYCSQPDQTTHAAQGAMVGRAFVADSHPPRPREGQDLPSFRTSKYADLAQTTTTTPESVQRGPARPPAQPTSPATPAEPPGTSAARRSRKSAPPRGCVGLGAAEANDSADTCLWAVGHVLSRGAGASGGRTVPSPHGDESGVILRSLTRANPRPQLAHANRRRNPAIIPLVVSMTVSS